MRSLRLAMGLLTVVPVRPVEPAGSAARNAMLLAPVAGLLAASPGLLLLLAFDRPSVALAALAVAALAGMTGGLHWDGLADTADGFAVPRGRTEPLTVMQRSDLGPTGALVIGLTLLVQVGALSALVDTGEGPTSWLLAVALSRGALPLVCVRGTPAARPDGLGAVVIGRVPPPVALGVTTLVVVVAAPLVASPGRTLAAAALAVATAWGLRAAAIRRFGGLTGDVLGAVVEVTAAACLVGLALAW